MKNWIKVGGHYINLDQVVAIHTFKMRINYSAPYPEGGRKPEVCLVFVLPVHQSSEGSGSAEEIEFFGRERENILAWLEYNPFAIHDIDDIPGETAPTRDGSELPLPPDQANYDTYEAWIADVREWERLTATD